MDHVRNIARLLSHTHSGRHLLSERRGRTRSRSRIAHEGKSKLSWSLVWFGGHLDRHSNELVLLFKVDCMNKIALFRIGCLWRPISVDYLEASQVSFAALFLEDIDLLNWLLLHVDWLPVMSFHAQNLWFLACPVCKLDTCKVLVASTPPTKGNLCNFHVINILASLENVSIRPAYRVLGYGATIWMGLVDLAIAKYGKAELSRPSVVITSVHNRHSNKFIVILEGNDFSFYTLVRIDHLLRSVAVVYLEAPQVFVVFLNNLNLLDWWLL